MDAHDVPADAGALALGIDVGTSSVKAMLVDRSGVCVAVTGRDHPVHRPLPGRAETDPEEWWSAVDAAVRSLGRAADLRRVVGVGLSGQMHGVVLVDDAGVAVRRAVLWQDGRAVDEARTLATAAPALRARLANPPSPGMAGPILAWLARHEPDVVRAARVAVAPKDWVRARLTGVVGGEPSDASATLLYDLAGDCWDDDAIDALAVPRRLLPDLASHSGDVAGGLLADVARRWGIAAGTPVAMGAADTAAAVLGSGTLARGRVQLTIGTGVQVVVPCAPRSSLALTDAPVTHLYRGTGPHDRYAMAAGLNGGAALGWVRELLGASWDELYAAAEGALHDGDLPVFVPYLVGERTPHLDASLRGAWTGLAAHHDRTSLLRGALVGVACGVADCVDALRRSVPTAGAGSLVLAGGGTVHPAWRSLLADVLGASLEAVDADAASARGAALLGLQAAGVLDGDALVAASAVAATPVATPTDDGRGARARARFRAAVAVAPAWSADA